MISFRTTGTRAAEMCDIGKERERNEDSVYISGDQLLLVVADGMGGHQGGALASKTVVDFFSDAYTNTGSPLFKAFDADQAKHWLRCTIESAASRLREVTAHFEGRRKPGTTLVVAVLLGDKLVVAHMGDSRAYLLRDDKLKQLTEDHSVVARLIRIGALTEEQAKTHPDRNIITRCLPPSEGALEQEKNPDFTVVDVEPGDRVLLCTDGLTGPVENYRIRTILAAHDQPDKVCGALVDAAYDGGAPDNVTVAVLFV